MLTLWAFPALENLSQMCMENGASYSGENTPLRTLLRGVGLEGLFLRASASCSPQSSFLRFARGVESGIPSNRPSIRPLS